MTLEPSQKFVILAILDGWGIAPPGPGNAISLAKTTNMDKLRASYPHTELSASGEAVGLPRGEDGNTETGHINIGAGRIVYQDLERINRSIADGAFFNNVALINAINHVKKNASKLHVMGLIGAGGVHSNIEHLFAIINLASKEKAPNLFLHLFTDGRDSPPTAAKSYIKQVEEIIEKEGIGTIASVMGRYWAMDRDQRWDRTKKAYFALTKGEGNIVKTPEEAVDKSYNQGKTDEFIEPSIIAGENDKPIVTINNDDAVIFFNFRVDRPRQLARSFVFDKFSDARITHAFDPYNVKYKKTHISKYAESSVKEPFDRGEKLNNIHFVTMTEYGGPLTKEGAIPAFPPEIIDTPISSVVSSSGLRQLKITESEKERFVNYYFNGLREEPFPQEERVIIPSPKVNTYDQKPEMSIEILTNTILHKLTNSEYKLIVVNFPNADMVGHTGNIGPTVKAVEAIDDAIGKITNHILAYDGILIITADHGNAEEMINNSTGEIDTEHSTNRVPFIVVSKHLTGKSITLPSGILADVAPTILKLLKAQVPSSMTGRNLLANIDF